VFLLTSMFDTNFILTLRGGYVRPGDQLVSEVVPKGKKHECPLMIKPSIVAAEESVHA